MVTRNNVTRVFSKYQFFLSGSAFEWDFRIHKVTEHLECKFLYLSSDIYSRNKHDTLMEVNIFSLTLSLQVLIYIFLALKTRPSTADFYEEMSFRNTALLTVDLEF